MDEEIIFFNCSGNYYSLRKHDPAVKPDEHGTGRDTCQTIRSARHFAPRNRIRKDLYAYLKERETLRAAQGDD
jgi:hypothetical protein